MNTLIRRFVELAVIVVGLCAFNHALLAQSTTNQEVVLFSTGFELYEGYDGIKTLAGQNGWVYEGSGGNGFVTNYFEGYGQQVFVGYAPPTDTNDTLSIWRPMIITANSNQLPEVEFSVLMSILDSQNQRYDDFRWSVYNTNGFRLFTLDFDNDNFAISYALDDGKGFVSTGSRFTNQVMYSLHVQMDFARNRWSARMDNTLLATNQLITTVGSALNLGDVDAVWAIRSPENPGDNYMLFDNYRIVAKNASPDPQPFPCKISGMAKVAGGPLVFQFTGQPLSSYAIESTTDWTTWNVLKTNTTSADGTFDFVDMDARNMPCRFYRARLVR